MVNSHQLKTETSTFLEKKIVAVGMFDAVLKIRWVSHMFYLYLKMKYIHDLENYCVTSVMICEVTNNSKIYLLDWKEIIITERGLEVYISYLNSIVMMLTSGIMLDG